MNSIVFLICLAMLFASPAFGQNGTILNIVNEKLQEITADAVAILRGGEFHFGSQISALGDKIEADFPTTSGTFLFDPTNQQGLRTMTNSHNVASITIVNLIAAKLAIVQASTANASWLQVDNDFLSYSVAAYEVMAVNVTARLETRLNQWWGNWANLLTTSGLRESRNQVLNSYVYAVSTLCSIFSDNSGKVNDTPKWPAARVLEAIGKFASEITPSWCQGPWCRELITIASQIVPMTNCASGWKPQLDKVRLTVLDRKP